MGWEFTVDGKTHKDYITIDPKELKKGGLERSQQFIREAWELLFMQSTLTMQKQILGKDENDLIAERSKEILDKMEINNG